MSIPKWVLAVITLVAGVMIPLASNAQDANRGLKFDVVSIKENKSDDRRPRTQFLPGGRYSATSVTLRMAISTAYGEMSRQTLGGPAWLDSERYDIEAKAESGVIPEGDKNRAEKTREMLRNLLQDRFKLAVHREMKEQPVYAIVVSKGGLKLSKSKIDEKDCVDTSALTIDTLDLSKACHILIGGQGRGLDAHTVNLSELASTLSLYTDRPVLDKTGLNGTFDIKLDPWLPLAQVAGASDDREPGLRDASRPSLFVLMEEQLGLKLESQKGEVETLVIDRAGKPMAEN
jgi:bla regulator protein blaR1